MATTTAAPAPGGDEGDRFLLSVEQFLAKAEGNAERFVRGAVVGLFNEIQSGGPYSPGTPVAVPGRWKKPKKGYVGGYHRASWQAEINAIPTGRLDPAIAGQPDAETAAAASVAANHAKAVRVKLGDVAHFVNGAPAIGRLEHGWSKQAPIGMMREAIRHWLHICEDVARHFGFTLRGGA